MGEPRAESGTSGSGRIEVVSLVTFAAALGWMVSRLGGGVVGREVGEMAVGETETITDG